MTDRTAMTLGRGQLYSNGRLIGEVKSGVVRSDPPQSYPRAVALWRGPIGPGAFQWTLVFGWRPDLAKPFDIVPVRFAVEVSRRIDLMAQADFRPGRRRWRIRFRSDFDLIERRIQYRAVARWLVHKLVGPNPTMYDYWFHEGRLEGIAWQTTDAREAQVALKGVEAIRGVMAEKRFTDRHARCRAGFFG